MENKKIQVCIIDDMLPFQNLFNDVDETNLIPSKQIELLLNESISWNDEIHLRNLTKMLVESDYYKSGKLNLNWAINPSICINSVKDINYKPDLIIYDWEYKNFATTNSTDFSDTDSLSAELLIELISLIPKCFFFVYSSKAQKIPIFIFKKHLDQHAKRFQVLLKGERKSILSSEELIYEYIALKIDNKPSIKIGDEQILFDITGHLENRTNYKDILYLEFILGKESLKYELTKHNNELSDEVIWKMLNNFPFYLYSTSDGKLFLSERSKTVESKFGELNELSYAEVYKKHGLETIYNILNNGIIKI